MNVWVGTERARLSDKDLLGVGGEARVYRWRDLALKLFHPVDRTVPSAERVRREKFEKLARFPAGLPPEVVTPVEQVTGEKGEPLGYAMRAVEGAEDVLRLGQRKWRQGVVSNAEVLDLFRRMHGALRSIQSAGVVVGDLNDSNVLFAKDQPYFIDADSMQFAGLPCVVGHERFLDPRLYGVDLAAAPAFSVATDWYAFAVLLFSSLLYVHPYGGLHPKFPTLLRRAEARHSILRPDVTVPRAAVHFRVLPDDLLGFFERTFDKDVRAELPLPLLGMSWTECRCGLEHARAACPDCASLGAAAAREAVRYHGRCTAKSVFRTPGRVLAAAAQGGLKYVYQEDGITRREDGSPVMEEPLQRGMRFALSGPSTWVGHGGRLVRVLHGQVAERASTGLAGNQTVFAANASTSYRTEGEWLVDGGAGTRIGQILEGQTWLRAGERLGFGFYRAGLTTFYFLFRHGRPGLVAVKLPQLEGRLVDASAVFDDQHVLFSTEVEKGGRLTGALYLVGEDGSLVAQASGPVDGTRVFASVRGRALLGGRVVCATDDGLLSLRQDTGRLVEGMLFSDTQPFVGAGVELVPGPGGSIYVVTTQEIVQLTLS